jgi:4-hydroxybenzoate polyprenyltransferase
VRGLLRLALLFWTMLRYRVALMMWTFMLVAVARHDGLMASGWRLGCSAAALACAYVAATSLNDVADREIDRINHPGDPARPLVVGTATERDLWLLHIVAAIGAVAAAAFLGSVAVGVVVLAVLVGQAYSLRPPLLSHRTYLAPVALAVAYVFLPYALGIEVAGGSWGRGDVPLAGGLLFLFLARISLKDFRDRSGDEAYGKPTLLLRFGKTATCAVSLTALIAGNVLLVVSLRPEGTMLVLLQAFFLAIASRLFAVWVAADARTEQVAIGVGAKMGNGLLILTVGWVSLTAHGAALGDRLLFAGSVATVFGLAFAALSARPERAILGYKG